MQSFEAVLLVMKLVSRYMSHTCHTSLTPTEECRFIHLSRVSIQSSQNANNIGSTQLMLTLALRTATTKSEYKSISEKTLFPSSSVAECLPKNLSMYHLSS